MDKTDQLKLNPIFSVSEYIEFLNIGLRKFGKAKITGEVSSVKIGPTGHVYFSIKDKTGKSMIDCIIWKSNYNLCGIKIEQGQELVLNGYPDIYAPRGKLSFKANTIQLKGEGALKKAYEELKKRLTQEGLFQEEKKRQIPCYPRKIGVITSRQGAVIHDLLNNLGKYGFRVELVDARVEGQEAVKDILQAIRTFEKRKIDVLVIMRGGGSLESMMPFNNETLVRAISNFPVPVIAGIGHDKDVPLLALVSDLMVSTPTAVASILNKSWDQIFLFLEKKKRKIVDSYGLALRKSFSVTEQSLRHIHDSKEMVFNEYDKIETRIKINFQQLIIRLQNIKIDLKEKRAKSISSRFYSFLSVIEKEISNANKTVLFNNPERQLKLGYNIARFNGKIIKDVLKLKIGQDISLDFSKGSVISRIKKINKNKYKYNE